MFYVTGPWCYISEWSTVYYTMCVSFELHKFFHSHIYMRGRGATLTSVTNSMNKA
jgi:hypothetical protein